ncbi:MAG: hypothetical protein NT088_02915 [Candidatus Omnitrophica bacterium]|nr:hypothetical protein [Candidatus Omnitrophota bacterium]
MKKFLLLCLCLALAWQIKVCASAEETPNSKYTINKIELSMNGNNHFSGRAIFYPPERKAVFEIINKGKMPFDFKDALFYAVTSLPNKAVYQLEYDKTYYKQNQRISLVSNPEDTTAIQCIVPSNFVYVSGAYIKLIDGTKIYFEYEELTAWQRFYKGLLKTIGISNQDKFPKDEEGWKTLATSSGKRFRYKQVDKEEKDWWENLPNNEGSAR